MGTGENKLTYLVQSRNKIKSGKRQKFFLTKEEGIRRKKLLKSLFCFTYDRRAEIEIGWLSLVQLCLFSNPELSPEVQKTDHERDIGSFRGL